MSFLTIMMLIAAILAATVFPVLGAVAEREPPGNLTVWIFLGFCALIVVAQVLPLVRPAVRRQPKAHQKEEPVEHSPDN